MAKDKDQKKAAASQAPKHESGGHHAAKAHGRATSVDMSLPATREELLARHADARKRRNAAALDSPAFRAAVDELGRIEVRVAAIEQAQTRPKG